MTQNSGFADPRHQIVIVGTGPRGRSAREALRKNGIGNIATVGDDLGPGTDVRGLVFDDDADTWMVKLASGKTFRAGIIILAHHRMFVPWIPDLLGSKSFRGITFHAAEWISDFEPAGRRIAMIGTDATSSHYIERLAESATLLTIFTHHPRRITAPVPLPKTGAKEWLRRHLRPPQDKPAITLVTSPIDTVTAAGIRTTDGIEHHAEAIIYGTGFAVSNRNPDITRIGASGQTIRQTWENGMEPYLGIAVHGFPNCFFITGPDIETQTHYVAECVGILKHTVSTRIEVRFSSQLEFNQRSHLKPAMLQHITSSFDLSSGADEDNRIYDGVATLTIASTPYPVHVRLTGHLDPNDGHYHWQGTVFGDLPHVTLRQTRAATLTVGSRSAPARIVEQTPWGAHSITGMGAPPYVVAAVEHS